MQEARKLFPVSYPETDVRMFNRSLGLFLVCFKEQVPKYETVTLNLTTFGDVRQKRQDHEPLQNILFGAVVPEL